MSIVEDYLKKHPINEDAVLRLLDEWDKRETPVEAMLRRAKERKEGKNDQDHDHR